MTEVFTGGSKTPEAQVRSKVALWGSEETLEALADWHRTTYQIMQQSGGLTTPQQRDELWDNYYRVLAAARRDLNPNSSPRTLSKDLLLGMIFGDYPQPENPDQLGQDRTSRPALDTSHQDGAPLSRAALCCQPPGRGVEEPHPIAAETAWKGGTVKGGACAIASATRPQGAPSTGPCWRATQSEADEAPVSARPVSGPAGGRKELALCGGSALMASVDERTDQVVFATCAGPARARPGPLKARGRALVPGRGGA
jgi:hypothetical protein